MFAFVSGPPGLPVLLAVVLPPLRWAVRGLLPELMRRLQAIAARLVLTGLATTRVFAHPTLPLHDDLPGPWLFWGVAAIAVTVSFFWPMCAASPAG